MKKSVLNELKKLAAELPSFKVRSKQGVKYSGEYLLSVNTMEVNGSAVDPDGTYTVYPLHEVNHETNLKSIYEKEGMEGVCEYCEKINDHFQPA